MAKAKRFRNQQLELFNRKIVRQFGGRLLKGNPKSKRPLSTKEAIHLVLKSKQATGPRSMLLRKNRSTLESIVRKTAQACFVSVYHFVNVGNHLHLVIRVKDLRSYRKFIRAISGLIARHVMGTERGGGLKFVPENMRRDLGDWKKAEKAEKKDASASFWIARPFTRLIAWGKDFQNVKKYMLKNQRQAQVGRGHMVAWGFDVLDPIKVQFLNTA